MRYTNAKIFFLKPSKSRPIIDLKATVVQIDNIVYVDNIARKADEPEHDISQNSLQAS